MPSKRDIIVQPDPRNLVRVLIRCEYNIPRRTSSVIVLHLDVSQKPFSILPARSHLLYIYRFDLPSLNTSIHTTIISYHTNTTTMMAASAPMGSLGSWKQNTDGDMYQVYKSRASPKPRPASSSPRYVRTWSQEEVSFDFGFTMNHC